MARVVGVTVLAFLLFAGINPGYGHELLPKDVLEFIKKHPDASPQEIQAFISGNAPKLGKRFESLDIIVRALKERETNFFDNSFDFLKLGVGHILSGPDHILFVFSLLLVFSLWREIFHLTITFTIAHSTTLLLSGAGLFTLPARIVEPVIAFSIAYVALTSVLFRRWRFLNLERLKIGSVFFFGLFHGLGFAGLLREIELPRDRFLSSLFSFNVGIEVGQLLIVALAVPLILIVRSRPWQRHATVVTALLIAAIALFWMVQRIVAGA